MSKIENLYSKEVKAQEIEFTFKAKTSNLNLLVEQRSNIQSISIALKGTKCPIPITSIHDHSLQLVEIKTFPGESYIVTAQTAGQGRGGDEPLKLILSAFWGE